MFFLPFFETLRTTRCCAFDMALLGASKGFGEGGENLRDVLTIRAKFKDGLFLPTIEFVFSDLHKRISHINAKLKE